MIIGEISTHHGLSLAGALVRTLQIFTAPLIVMSWTLRPAVAYILQVYADGGTQAAVEARTRHVPTPFLILSIDAVKIAVASSVSWETVWQVPATTAVVCIWTRIVQRYRSMPETSSSVQVYDRGNVRDQSTVAVCVRITQPDSSEASLQWT